MSIDSRLKRQSAATFKAVHKVPMVDGDIDYRDRVHISWNYAGLAALFHRRTIKDFTGRALSTFMGRDQSDGGGRSLSDSTGRDISDKGDLKEIT
jgi:hypothetical protein